LAAQRLPHPIDKDRRPGLYRRVDIAEVPLIGRDLSGWMQIGLAEQQIELLLGEIDVYARQGYRVERQVSGGEPGIFPLVRHRYDMVAQHVEPITVPHLALFGQQRICAVLVEPLVDVEKEILLAPQHSG